LKRQAASESKSEPEGSLFCFWLAASSLRLEGAFQLILKKLQAGY
jgi:hypothetical protein